jgi:hypothetical protein
MRRFFDMWLGLCAVLIATGWIGLFAIHNLEIRLVDAEPHERFSPRDHDIKVVRGPLITPITNPDRVIRILELTEEEAPDEAASLFWFDSSYRPGDQRLTRIIAVGDIMAGTSYPSAAHLNPALYEGIQVDTLLDHELLGILRGADITFGNLEGVLQDSRTPAAKSCARCFSFRSPEYYAKIFAEAGFNVMSLANNHSGDFGEAGRKATMGALDRAGIAYAGLDQPGVRTVTLTVANGTRVGMVAVAPNVGTVHMHDLDGVVEIVRGLKQNHDIVIVSFHGGAEGMQATRVTRQREIHMGEDRGNVHDFAHRMVATGADLILGHGPHVPRAVEIVNDRLVAYSLGNFWTYGLMLNWGTLGIGPVLDAYLTPDGRIAGFRIHSTRQAGLGVPHIDPLGEAERLTLDLTRRDFPEAYERLRNAIVDEGPLVARRGADEPSVASRE